MRISFLILTITLLFSCDDKHKQAVKDTVMPVRETREPDNQEIYEILKLVIEDQNLDKQLGIKAEPVLIDKHFLAERVDDASNQSSIETKNGRFIFDGDAAFQFTPQQWLTHDDVEYMSSQIELSKKLRWDNTRLGFNTGNFKSWYEFSVRCSQEIVQKPLSKYIGDVISSCVAATHRFY